METVLICESIDKKSKQNHDNWLKILIIDQILLKLIKVLFFINQYFVAEMNVLG